MLFLPLILGACAKSVSTDTVESLVANPTRLDDVMRHCHENREKIGDASCSAASEAFRRRFIGDGKAQYTPQQ